MDRAGIANLFGALVGVFLVALGICMLVVPGRFGWLFSFVRTRGDGRSFVFMFGASATIFGLALIGICAFGGLSAG